MNRGDARNALSEELVAVLREQIGDLSRSQSIKAVVIAANGPAFCAGHDIRELESHRQDDDGGRSYFERTFSASSTLMLEIMACPKPVIAAVSGTATAAGCQLVATCDLAVAAETARFGVNGINIGLFCSTPMVALSRNIGRKQTFELLTTGEFLSADKALEFGLINRAVPEADLAAETRALADKVASKLGSAVRIGKRAFYEQLEMTLDDAYAHTGRVIAENMLHPDTAEGVQAFLEKRPPDWPD